MIDKSLNIFMILLFGVSGLAMLLLAWLQPSAVSERITAFIIGFVGLFVASIRALMLRKENNAQHTKVEAED